MSRIEQYAAKADYWYSLAQEASDPRTAAALERAGDRWEQILQRELEQAAKVARPERDAVARAVASGEVQHDWDRQSVDTPRHVV